MRRSARFEVSWCSGTDSQGQAPEHVQDDDYIVLEMKPGDLRRLKEQIDLTLAMDEALAKEGKSVDDGCYTCLLLHGRAHAQRADRKDGSLLSAEVLAETPQPDRWKPASPTPEQA